MYVFVCIASVVPFSKNASVLCGLLLHPIAAVLAPSPFPEQGVGLKLDQPDVLSLAFKYCVEWHKNLRRSEFILKEVPEENVIRYCCKDVAWLGSCPSQDLILQLSFNFMSRELIPINSFCLIRLVSVACNITHDTAIKNLVIYNSR